MSPLPIDTILPSLLSQFLGRNNVVLSADPGAGKTTRVPLALLNEPWTAKGKIVMLEPRRIAAVRSAEYMAQLLNEKPGETVGYRIRGESRIGPRTRIEVVTEGILTRMIHDDPTLTDVSLVIFDEFHERSIHADVGLALTLDIQEQIRHDLRILVMSATIDVAAVSLLLGNAPVVASEGRVYPVETIYLSQQYNGQRESIVASTILKALQEQKGDILVFLPGQREIRKTESLLGEKDLPNDVQLFLLYSEAPPDEQRAALRAAPAGKRKIILSTNVAETSVTIDGVRVVIDSGLSRISSFDPKRGMSGLVTTSVSQAAADQRRGRAGRQQPGVCYRLWTLGEQALLPAYSVPEILTADLASVALDLIRWGDPDAQRLRFLQRPPLNHLRQAQMLLRFLGARDENGKLTEHGNNIADVGIHPRYAHMLIRANRMGFGRLACDLAALLDERDLLRGNLNADIDITSRYQALHRSKAVDKSIVQRVREQSIRLRKVIDVRSIPQTTDNDERCIGKIISLAYPERVAKRKDKSEKYQLMGNTVGNIPKNSILAGEEYLAVAEVDGAGNEVKIFLADSITEESVRDLFTDQIQTTTEVVWDERQESVVARSVEKFGAIQLSVRAIEPDPEETRKILCDVVKRYGLTVLPWDKGSESLRVRSEWLRKQGMTGNSWVDLSDTALLLSVDQWLAPYLTGIRSRSHFAKLDMKGIITSFFTYDQLKEIERLAPTQHTVPTGSLIPIDYSQDRPVVAVRLQEMFGETETPTVGGGKIKVLLHLLSPAQRPLAVTQDLPSFWKNAYAEVKKDMRGQYPKHYWPDDPLEAKPTKKTKKYMGKL